MEQAKANAELARLTKERDLPLGEQHAMAQQIVEEAVQTHNVRVADVSAASANVVAAEANVNANRANVARLLQMQGFEQVVAPFDGTITQRNVERGDLVKGGSVAVGKPLFSIAQSGLLRIQVDVPQTEAARAELLATWRWDIGSEGLVLEGLDDISPETAVRFGWCRHHKTIVSLENI
jgi:multidrug efflux pump subunit AcrA (membrane-fusion protein)